MVHVSDERLADIANGEPVLVADFQLYGLARELLVARELLRDVRRIGVDLPTPILDRVNRLLREGK